MGKKPVRHTNASFSPELVYLYVTVAVINKPTADRSASMNTIVYYSSKKTVLFILNKTVLSFLNKTKALDFFADILFQFFSLQK